MFGDQPLQLLLLQADGSAGHLVSVEAFRTSPVESSGKTSAELEEYEASSIEIHKIEHIRK